MISAIRIIARAPDLLALLQSHFFTQVGSEYAVDHSVDRQAGGRMALREASEMTELKIKSGLKAALTASVASLYRRRPMADARDSIKTNMQRTADRNSTMSRVSRLPHDDVQ